MTAQALIPARFIPHRPYVLDQDLDTPPGSPSAGDRYIVAAGGSGDWNGHDGEIAHWTGVKWIFEAPEPGWLVRIDDVGTLWAYDGAAWNELAGSGGAVSSVFGRTGAVVAVAGDYNATQVSAAIAATWADASGIVGVTVDAAIEEILTDLADASGVDGADRIGYSGDSDTPTSLSAGSVGSAIVALLAAVNARALAADLTAHIGDTSDAHDASAISYQGSGNNWADGSAVSSNDVEAALDEVVTDLAGSAGAAKVGGAQTDSLNLRLAAAGIQASLQALLDLLAFRDRAISWRVQPRGNSTTFDAIGTGAPTVTASGGTAASPDPGLGYAISMATNTTNGNAATYVGTTRIRLDFALPGTRYRWLVLKQRVRLASDVATNTRVWCGWFSADPSGSNDPTLHGIGFRRLAGTDTNWQCWCNDNSGGGGFQDSTVLASASTWYDLEVTWDGTTLRFYIDGAEVHSTTSNLPSISTYLAERITLTLTAGGSARSIGIGPVGGAHA